MKCPSCGASVSQFDVNCRSCDKRLEIPSVVDQLAQLGWQQSQKGHADVETVEFLEAGPGFGGIVGGIAKTLGAAAGSMAAEATNMAVDAATLGTDHAIANSRQRVTIERAIRKSRE